MLKFHEYVARRLSEVEGDGIGPGLADLAGPKEFGDDPAHRGGTTDAKEAFKDLSETLCSAISSPNGKALLNQFVASVMSDTQVHPRVKKEIEEKVKARWSGVIDITDATGRSNQPRGTPDQRPGAGGVDNFHKANVKMTGADSGF